MHYHRNRMQAPGDTKLDSELVDGPPSGGLDAAAMRSRLAARLFGEEAGDVSIGRFAVVESIGVGGMGVVYLATDPKLGRRVALKLLHPTAVGNEVERMRLLREAQALAKLSHPNVVQLYEVGEHEGSIFLAMEYVEGVSLRQWQTAQRRTWRQTLTQYIQAGEGLAAAHAAGLVHRDFKPANVIVGNDGRARVADFGLARGPGLSSQGSSDEGGEAASAKSPADSTITRPGAVIGTPAYMSPEQLRGDSVDARSDQFSFCIALWEALHGERPYAAEALRHGSTAEPPKRGPSREVPRWVDKALRRGLALRPGERFDGLAELVEALRPQLKSPRKLSIVTGVSSAALVLAMSTWALEAKTDCNADLTLQGVWDAERRHATKSAVEASGAVGRDVWPALERAVDAYADEWRGQVEQACTLPRGVRETRDPLTRACLQRARDQFDQVIDLAASGDRAAIGDGSRLLAAVQEPTACLSPNPPSATDTDLDAAKTLDRARLLLALGRPQEATWLLDDGKVGAACEHNLGLESHALLLRSTALTQMAEVEGAVEAVEEAITSAIAGNEPAAEAEGLLLLADLEGAGRENVPAAKRALRLAEAVATRAELDDSARVKAAMVRARVLRRAGQPQEAVGALLAVLPAARQLPTHKASVAATAIRELGNALVAARRFREAGELYDEADRFHRAAFGDKHAEMAELDLARGLLARAEGRDAAAVELLERAYEKQEAIFGPDSPRIARAALACGEMKAKAGELEAAEALATLAWRQQQVMFPVGHSERGGALYLRAMVERARGRRDLYIESMRQLAAEWESGANAWQLPKVINNIAYHLTLEDRLPEAEYYYEWLQREARDDELLSLYARAGLVKTRLGRADAETSLRELEAVREAYLATRSVDDNDVFLAELQATRRQLDEM